MELEKKRYHVSLVFTRHGDVINVKLYVAFVYATTPEEAFGIAVMDAQKDYPEHQLFLHATQFG
jgi:hypothetical protein